LEKYKNFEKKKKFKNARERFQEIEEKIKPYSQKKYYERKEIERWDVYDS
jgi:hypothetical protein